MTTSLSPQRALENKYAWMLSHSARKNVVAAVKVRTSDLRKCISYESSDLPCNRFAFNGCPEMFFFFRYTQLNISQLNNTEIKRKFSVLKVKLIDSCCYKCGDPHNVGHVYELVNRNRRLQDLPRNCDVINAPAVSSTCCPSQQ